MVIMPDSKNIGVSECGSDSERWTLQDYPYEQDWNDIMGASEDEPLELVLSEEASRAQRVLLPQRVAYIKGYLDLVIRTPDPNDRRLLYENWPDRDWYLPSRMFVEQIKEFCEKYGIDISDIDFDTVEYRD